MFASSFQESDTLALTNSLSASSLQPQTTLLQTGTAELVDPLQSVSRLTGASDANGPLITTGNTLGTATNIGALNGRWSFSDSVSPGDRYDFFRFTTATGKLDVTLTGSGGDADIYVIQDLNGNGQFDVQGFNTSTGQFISNEIVELHAIAGNQESISINGLATGTYYTLVYEYASSTTNYNVTMTLDTAGNTLATARQLGTLSGNTTVKDFVGNSDPDDFYRFQINTTSTLNLSLTGLTADADLALIRDVNQNGIVDDEDILEESLNLDNDSEFITVQGLTAGTYFAQIAQYSGNTNYTLGLSVSPDEPGNTLATATNLGVLAGRRTLNDSIGYSFSGSVSYIDSDDFYRFSLSAVSDLELKLTGLSSNSDADLYLIQDKNNNGVVDANDVIQQSLSPGNIPETISLTGLPAGTYFVRVARYSGSTDYTLSLTADTAGETLATARNIGTLTGTRSFTDFIGLQDPSDLYRFNLNSTSNLNLSLTGLSADADLYLIRDFNNNGLIDKSEMLAISAKDGTVSESISVSSLSAGTYYVWVNQYSGNTNYKLNLSLVTPSDV